MWVELGKKESNRLLLPCYILLLILFFTAFACKQNSSSVQIDFSKIEDSSQAISESQQSGTVRFAMAAGNSPLIKMNLYGELFEYIGKKLDTPVQFVQRKTYAEINELLRTGDIDFAK